MFRFLRLFLFLCALPLAWLSTPIALAETSSPADSSYSIPSSEQLGNDQVITHYRAQYQPELYHPESINWAFFDIAALTLILILGSIMVWRHVHFKWFWIPSTLTLFYFGVLRGGCICPVGATANFSLALAHPERIGITTAIIFLLPLVFALFFGRIFCSAGCPLGAVQHLLSRNTPPKIPQGLKKFIPILPVISLISTVWLILDGSCILVCALDPYKTLFFFSYGWFNQIVHFFQGGLVEPRILWVGNAAAWSFLIFSLLLGLVFNRPFCRFLCPYGVLLGAISKFSFKQRVIDNDPCVGCGVCEKRCPVHAISQVGSTRTYQINSYLCIQCNRCSSHCRKNGIR